MLMLFTEHRKFFFAYFLCLLDPVTVPVPCLCTTSGSAVTLVIVVY